MRTTANKNLDALYPDHLRTIRQRYDEALAAQDLDAVVIGAGVEIYRFLDDLTHPFRPNPHFLQWVPLLNHPGSALIYQPGQQPELLLHEPETYWHTTQELPGGAWQDFFKVTSITGSRDLRTAYKTLPAQTAWLGDPAQWTRKPNESLQNPDGLLTHLHYYRPVRTAYEVECVKLATLASVAGHQAAEQSFRGGASEYEILISFLTATGRTENELPYPAIIAKNEHGATLHYQHYDRSADASHSLLIDAACDCNGYASDITRTYSYDDAEFAALIARLDSAQQRIAEAVVPGKAFADLHALAHREIATILQDADIVHMTPDEQLELDVTSTFFPHGLGHFLGLQVHEVGGAFSDPQGTEPERPERYPNLRLIRQLETGQLLTIEPGIYFIGSLLTKLQNQPAGKAVNWEKVKQLGKFGGIRIEDNLLITETGSENITRNAF